MRYILDQTEADRAFLVNAPITMRLHAEHAARFILNIAEKCETKDVLVETRIFLDFIHPEMFGTFDGAVLDFFGTLHVFDYKYGAGTFVSPKENLQMIFYGIGLAYLHHWNFKKVRLWIIQPRVRGYDGPLFWDVSIKDLKDHWVPQFQKAVARVESRPNEFNEGSWCHWCKAKTVCPLKMKAKEDNAKFLFGNLPLISREYSE